MSLFPKKVEYPFQLPSALSHRKDLDSAGPSVWQISPMTSS